MDTKLTRETNRNHDIKLNHDTKLRIILICAIVCCIVDIFLYFYLGYSKYDVKGHWKICAYTLRGYDPFPLIGKKAVIKEIGKIRSGFSTVPWACVLGNIFYVGFLPLKAAFIYIWVLHFVVFGFTAVIIWKEWRSHLDRTEFIAVLLLLIGQFSFMYSLRYGNNGAIICLLVIDSILLARNHPWISGILLGLALMKPQISGIVCFVFLLQGCWKPLLLAGGTTIIGLLSTSLVTSASVIQLIRGCLGSATSSPLQYLGLFSFLTNLGMEKLHVMLINMLTGIAYTAVLFFLLRRGTDRNSTWYFEISFVPACIASTFWIYKNGTDYQIVSFTAVLLLLLLVKKEVCRQDMAAGVLMILYMQMSRSLVYLAQIMISKEPLARALLKGTEGLLLAVCGIWFCRLWIRYELPRKESRKK